MKVFFYMSCLAFAAARPEAGYSYNAPSDRHNSGSPSAGSPEGAIVLPLLVFGAGRGAGFGANGGTGEFGYRGIDRVAAASPPVGGFRPGGFGFGAGGGSGEFFRYFSQLFPFQPNFFFVLIRWRRNPGPQTRLRSRCP
jgi:hypothetical protein